MGKPKPKRARKGPAPAVRRSRAPAYLVRAAGAEKELARAWRSAAVRHADDPSIRNGCEKLAKWNDRHEKKAADFAKTHGPARARIAGVKLAHFRNEGRGSLGILLDLQDLSLLVEEAATNWTVVGMTASALEDEDLERAADLALEDLERERTWLHSLLKQLASQAVTVVS